MASIINATTTNGVAVQGDNSGSLQLQTNNGTTAVTIDTSQRLLVGTTSGARNFVLGGGSGNSIMSFNNDSTGYAAGDGFQIQLSSTNASIWTYENDYIRFGTNDTERMRIGSNGNVGIGKTNTSNERLSVRGSDNTQSTSSFSAETNAGTSQLYLRNDNYFNSGAIANYSVAGTALVIDVNNFVGKTTSSLRYKKDIVDYDKGLDAIAKLRPVYYKSAVEGPNGLDPKQHAGFIAEEIADEGFEEFLVRNQDGEPDAIQYAQMTALLCKAIQELKAELDATKAEVQALKGVA